MTNAEIILGELDSRLDSKIELTLFGRAALSLGFEEPREEFGQSLDVDAVLPIGAAEVLFDTSNFWQAVEETNEVLAPKGLYVSHFFTEDQVILTKSWLETRIPIDRDWNNLTLFRLSDEDLLLSKLMRDDPHDFRDALFIARRRHLGSPELEEIAQAAKIPDSPEIQEEFQKALLRLNRYLVSHS